MAKNSALNIDVTPGGSAEITFPNSSQTLIGGLGWVSSGETWTYSSVDDPTGVITVPSDATTKYSEGMRIKFTNGGNTIYGIITAVTSTTITFLHEIDPTDSQALHLMANSGSPVVPITNPYFSPVKAPFGFPLERDKWTVEVTDTTDRTQASPTANTVYNIGSLSIDIPIGAWDFDYEVLAGISTGGSVNGIAYFSMSTSTSTESDSSLTSRIIARAEDIEQQFLKRGKPLNLSVKDTYYVIMWTVNSSMSSIVMVNSQADFVTRAICSYL